MPRLLSLASLSRAHFVRSLSSDVLQSGWTILNTGLSSAHTICKPTYQTVGGFHHFGLIGGTQSILKYDPWGATFSSQAGIGSANLTDSVTRVTNLSAVSPSGPIYGAFRRTYSSSPLTYFSVYLSSSDGVAYTSSRGSSSSYSLPVIGLYPEYIADTSTSGNTIGIVYIDGRFQYASFGGSFSNDYFGPTYTNYGGIFNGYDCKSVAYDDVSGAVLIAGGAGTTAKIMRILFSSLGSNQAVAWNTVTNTIGQAISKLHVASVYLNYTYNSVTGSYTSSGSRSQIFLAGCVDGRIARSTDAGVTWSVPASQPFSAGDTVVGFANWEIGIFAVTNTGKIAYSLNGGVTWEIVSIGQTISSLEFVASTASYRILIGGANAFLASWSLPPYIQS